MPDQRDGSDPSVPDAPEETRRSLFLLKSQASRSTGSQSYGNKDQNDNKDLAHDSLPSSVSSSIGSGLSWSEQQAPEKCLVISSATPVNSKLSTIDSIRLCTNFLFIVSSIKKEPASPQWKRTGSKRSLSFSSPREPLRLPGFLSLWISRLRRSS